jgi:hypothetical protein
MDLLVVALKVLDPELVKDPVVVEEEVVHPTSLKSTK